MRHRPRANLIAQHEEILGWGWVHTMRYQFIPIPLIPLKKDGVRFKGDYNKCVRKHGYLWHCQTILPKLVLNDKTAAHLSGWYRLVEAKEEEEEEINARGNSCSYRRGWLYLTFGLVWYLRSCGNKHPNATSYAPYYRRDFLFNLKPRRIKHNTGHQ